MPDPKAVEKTVAELRHRIRDDRDYIARYEVRTRVVLIDPLLRVLGWDPENSRDVQLEFSAGRGNRLDYVLMRNGEPVAVIEAKRLDENQGTDVVQQLRRYTNAPKCPTVHLAAATDGNQWIFWRKSGRWRKHGELTMSSGQSRTVARDLVKHLSPVNLGVKAAAKPRRAKVRATRARRGKWYPLVAEVLPDGVPTAVQLGDEEPYDWENWRGLYADVAEYLVENGYIRESHLPVRVAKGKYFAINHEPVHPLPDRKPFKKSEPIGGNMWLETYGNWKSMRRYAVRLLREFHSDAESVQVRFD